MQKRNPRLGDSEELEEGSNASDADDNGNDDDGNEVAKELTEAERDSQKRKIDSIWEEMNKPATTRGNKSLKIESEEPPAPQAAAKRSDSDRPAASTATVGTVGFEQAEKEGSAELLHKDKAPVRADGGTGGSGSSPVQQKPAALRRGPARKASKFSKLAEQVEQRRAKKENTLDKARKEWVGFVSAEGIRDDLDKANKDGFIERQGFLNRVNERTYERSREQKQK
ncbi:swr complex subunit [Dipsacomyces acuminosporus]|nr:swr complex subunit [Dipsacomyces acuminosporus]